MPTGLRLFSAPRSAEETLTRDFVHSIAWRKTDAMWQRRQHAGKRLVMFMSGRYRASGWRWLLTLDGLYRNGVVVFGGPDEGDEAPLPPRAPPPTPMMSVTVVSAKKLQPDFNISNYYTGGNSGGGGRRGHHRSVSSALSAFETSGGAFEQSERVVRYPEGSFDLNPVSSSSGSVASVSMLADWTLLRLLAGLYREGWAIMGSTNISGKEKAVVSSKPLLKCQQLQSRVFSAQLFSTHTIFLIRGQGARAPQPRPKQQLRPQRPPYSSSRAGLRTRVDEWMERSQEDWEERETMASRQLQQQQQPQQHEREQDPNTLRGARVNDYVERNQGRGGREEEEREMRRRRRREEERRRRLQEMEQQHQEEEDDDFFEELPPSYEDVMSSEPSQRVVKGGGENW